MTVQVGDKALTPNKSEPGHVRVLSIYHEDWGNNDYAVVEFLHDQGRYRTGDQGEYYLKDLVKVSEDAPPPEQSPEPPVHSIKYGLPEPYRDALNTDVDLHFDLLDRIKILFGGIPVVKVHTMVENPPGKLEVEARVFIMGPHLVKPKPLGVVESQPHNDKITL